MHFREQIPMQDIFLNKNIMKNSSASVCHQLKKNILYDIFYLNIIDIFKFLFYVYNCLYIFIFNIDVINAFHL